MERVLDAFRPDLVHLHHLGGGLSTSFVGLVRRRGLPTALTLHDYWFMCPRSTPVDRDGRLCPGPDGGLRCTACWIADHYDAARPSLGRIRGLGMGESLRRAPRWLADRLLPPGRRRCIPIIPRGSCCATATCGDCSRRSTCSWRPRASSWGVTSPGAWRSHPSLTCPTVWTPRAWPVSRRRCRAARCCAPCTWGRWRPTRGCTSW